MNKGALLGFANLFVKKMGLEINGCSLFQKDGRRWITMPQREFVVDGEKKYFPVIRFREKDHMEIFGEAAKKAIDEWCLSNPHDLTQNTPQVRQKSFDFSEDEGVPF